MTPQVREVRTGQGQEREGGSSAQERPPPPPPPQSAQKTPRAEESEVRTEHGQEWEGGPAAQKRTPPPPPPQSAQQTPQAKERDALGPHSPREPQTGAESGEMSVGASDSNKSFTKDKGVHGNGDQRERKRAGPENVQPPDGKRAASIAARPEIPSPQGASPPREAKVILDLNTYQGRVVFLDLGRDRPEWEKLGQKAFVEVRKEQYAQESRGRACYRLHPEDGYVQDYRGALLNADGTTGHWFPWTEEWARNFEQALGGSKYRA